MGWMLTHTNSQSHPFASWFGLRLRGVQLADMGIQILISRQDLRGVTRNMSVLTI